MEVKETFLSLTVSKFINNQSKNLQMSVFVLPLEVIRLAGVRLSVGEREPAFPVKENVLLYVPTRCETRASSYKSGLCDEENSQSPLS